jgi:hypothetical protein
MARHTTDEAVSVPAFGLADDALHGELVVAPARAAGKSPVSSSEVRYCGKWNKILE